MLCYFLYKSMIYVSLWKQFFLWISIFNFLHFMQTRASLYSSESDILALKQTFKNVTIITIMQTLAHQLLEWWLQRYGIELYF